MFEAAAIDAYGRTGRCWMGDKSPKAKDKNHKQHESAKNRQKAAIQAKAPVSAAPKPR